MAAKQKPQFVAQPVSEAKKAKARKMQNFLVVEYAARTFAVVVLILLWQTSYAAAAERAPSEVELKRFITAYRVGESSFHTFRLAVKASKNASVEKQKYIQCMADKMTPEIAEATALVHAREQLPSADRLAELTAYFEGPAGKKLLDQLMRNLQQAIEKDKFVRDALNAPTPSFTAEELAESNSLRQKTAYQDFQRFVHSMKSESAKVHVPAVVAKVRELCGVNNSLVERK
jgi:pyocin large subunit-like protein